ncbi:hypothetical protein JCM19237_1879 [Photobacterium aphoticum]|uniref:Uncharacterized protein n=1 Tax=Photobacterium aphoticum TaxID=754436 RepID=A0A090QWI7_9GAMM|nr:hypothetical protein JCM19237_1879 [Photobacterium aphoticum]
MFNRETLHDFSERVSDVSKALEKESAEKFNQLKSDFVTFTNVSWFQEVSSQIQGKEIYQKITAGLNLEKEYALIEKEVDAADGHFGGKRLAQLTLVATGLAMFMLIAESLKLFINLSNGKEYEFVLAIVFILFATVVYLKGVKDYSFREMKKDIHQLWGKVSGWFKRRWNKKQ